MTVTAPSPEAPTDSSRWRRLGSGRRVLVVALALYIVGGVVYLATGGGAPSSGPQSAASVDGVGGIEFDTLDGERASLSEYSGTPLVVNFFASTCAPCRAEMPDFERAFQARSGDVSFLGLATEGERPARGVVEETGVTYDIGLDPFGDLLIDFGGFGLPTTVFISADGEILEALTSVLSAEMLDDLLHEHFAL